LTPVFGSDNPLSSFHAQLSTDNYSPCSLGTDDSHFLPFDCLHPRSSVFSNPPLFFYSRTKSTNTPPPPTACSTHRQAVYKDSHSNLKIAVFKTPPPQESDLRRGIFCLFLSGGGTIMRKESVRRKPPKCEFCLHNCNKNCVIKVMIVVQTLFAYLFIVYLITLSVPQLI